MCRSIIIASTFLTAIVWVGTLRAADENRPEPPRDRPSSAEDQAALFDRLDANHDGQITSDEVPEEHRRLFERLLRRADKNGDGKISREEFMAAQSEDRPAGPPDGPPRDGGPQGPGGGVGGFGGFGAGGPGMPGPVMGIALFRALDTNGDGKLDAKEIAAASEVLKKLANSEGVITREELLKTMPVPQAGGGFGGGGSAGGFGSVAAGLSPDAVIKRMIEQFDKNGDGKLQKDELPPRLQARFDELDTNHDGALDESELKAVLPQLMRRFQQGNAQNDGNALAPRNLRRLMDAAAQPKPADKPDDKDKK
jgi:Ca2+-binding EF-hand superfamily protein